MITTEIILLTFKIQLDRIQYIKNIYIYVHTTFTIYNTIIYNI